MQHNSDHYFREPNSQHLFIDTKGNNFIFLALFLRNYSVDVKEESFFEKTVPFPLN